MPAPRSILFVDDYDMLRQIYVEILSDAGYRVKEAADAEQCLHQLNQEVPDLILLDIMMKPVDGWEILRQIRSRPSCVDVPVIMVSGKAILPSEIHDYGPLFEGFIRKPLLNVTLLSEIHDFFIWYDALREECSKSRFHGVDNAIVSSYFSLKRKERSLTILLSMIRREYDTGDDKMATDIISEAMRGIEETISDISDKIRETGNSMHLTPRTS